MNTWGARVIVDLGFGPGDMLANAYPQARKIGLDIYPDAVSNASPDIEAHRMDMRSWWEAVGDSECDVAMLIDTLEHVNKADGEALLRSLQRSFNKILIFTPSGFVAQAAHSGNSYQEHLSGWTKEELENFGFEVVELPMFHSGKYGALLAIWLRPGGDRHS